MKKILTLIIMIISLLGSSYLIAAEEAVFNRTGSTRANGEMLGNDVLFSAEDSKPVLQNQEFIGKTSSALNSNAVRHVYYDIRHTQEMINKITRKTFLDKVPVNDLTAESDYSAPIMSFKVENNTRDGFLIGWFNKDNLDGSNSAVSYALNPESRDDGESEIPYNLQFNWESENNTRTHSAAIGDLNNVTIGAGDFGNFARLATIAQADNGSGATTKNEDFVVVLNGSAGNEFAITKATEGLFTVYISFDNANLLKFAGSYNTENRIAFIDL